MACNYYNITISQLDLDNAINNSDSNLDGKVFVSYTDCNGEPISQEYTEAGFYSSSFCADPSEAIFALYWYDDLGNLSRNTSIIEGGNCVAPTPTPTVTPSVSISPTPSTTPLYECNCISFTNPTDISLTAFYNTCNGFPNARFTVPRGQTIVVCGSNPSGADLIIDILGTCVGNQCIPFTPTPTPSLSITPTISVSPSVTPSNTPSISITPSNTPSISVTPSITPSKTVPPSMTPTPTISVSKSPSITPLPSVSKTPSISVSPSITPSVGTSPSPTPSTSPSGSIPTVAGLCMNIQFGAAPSVTPSISVTPSVTPSNTPSITPTISVSATPSLTPSTTPSVTPSITPSITPSTTPSSTNPPPPPSLTPSNTPSISITPSITPSTSISNTPNVTPSKSPSITRTPSVTPSRTPSVTPSRTPSVTISPTPSTSIPCTPCSLPDVVIGTQTWTACNLDVTTYRNGDVIPQVTDPTAWNNLTTGAWCYYQNNSSFGCTYNKLYNWYAVNDPRGLAPAGYHIPTEAEIETLRNYLGGTTVAGGKLKQTGTTLWNSPNTGATNETGWTGLPGGARENAQFSAVGVTGPFWTSTSSSLPGFSNMAVYSDLYSFNATLDLKAFNKTSGYAVRLIKDVPNPTTCNTILYKTQANQYYSYNFSTNTSTLLNVPAAPYDSVATSLGISIAPLARTSNKLWSYTWNVNGGNLNNNSIVEYNTTSNPFAATINRYIALPQIGIEDFYPGTGLFAISDTKLIGTINRIGGQELSTTFTEPEFNDPIYPLRKYANGAMVVEYDITSNIATWTLKVKLLAQEKVTGGLLLTLDNKLIVLTKNIEYNNYWISQYNYNTGVLEFRSKISPTITTDCGLAEVNGEIYIMGYNIYKFNRITHTLELTQSPQTQLVASSQLASCINVNLPTSSCPECIGLPLKLSTPVTYGDVTISPTYTGPLFNAQSGTPGAADNLFLSPQFGCTGSNVVNHPSYSVWLGGAQQNPYTYSLNFSEPVNNIKLIYDGNDTNILGTLYETFIWDTNGGTPNISLCKGCGQIINGNTISASWGTVPVYPEIGISGGGIITISAPLNYTTLTLRSPGGNQGTVFGICSGSIIPQPSNTLGCVYYSKLNSSNQPVTYLYNVNNNTSTQVTLPTDTFNSFAEAHTSTKYWKGNQTDTIKEWVPTSAPNVLTLNRTINVSGITSAFGNYFTLLAPVNNNTLLTTIAPAVDTCALISLDITDTNVTTNNITTLFTFDDQFVDSMLLTSNNKIITIGRTGSNVYLTQYSYPTGTQEVRTDITSIGFTQNVTQFYLFESNGNLYFSKQGPQPTSIIYQVNLTTYEITTVYSDLELFGATFNSSTECNTAVLSPIAPSPSPSVTPTPSLTPPVSPNVGVNTIYKYLDIL